MKIFVRSENFKHSEQLASFVEKHTGKLELLSDRILEADVNLRLEKSGDQENSFCEIRLSIPGNDLFASKKCETFEEAVDQAVDALRHQLKRWKGAGLDAQRTPRPGTQNLEAI